MNPSTNKTPGRNAPSGILQISQRVFKLVSSITAVKYFI